MLIDSHCHLHDREFFTAEQAEGMTARAHEAGIEKIICIGTNHEDSLAAQEFASSHQNIYWTYGIHPEYASGAEVPSENIFSRNNFRFDRPKRIFLTDPTGSSRRDGSAGVPVYDVEDGIAGSEKDILDGNHIAPVAIGEVGLDYHYEGYDREAQIRLFEQMLQLATDNDLPVSFHIREAYDDFFPVLANFPKIRGVVHSFTDNKRVLRRILNETEFFVGVNGLATYSTLPTPPLERILLETDAPFLTPEPFRGIINEPAYIRKIAEWLSRKIGQEYQVIEVETTKNARKLFGI